MTEAQLRFRPAADAWSIAEVAQHLLEVERNVVRAMRKQDVQRRGRRRKPREWLGYGLFLAVVHLNVRIKVPRQVAGLVTPSPSPDMDQLWSDWRQTREDLTALLEKVQRSALRDMAFKHPILGPTSVRGTLPFFLKHFRHHMRQVTRIRAANGFPRA